MTRATTLRRTYTKRQNDDDSVMCSSTSSSTSSASESRKSAYTPEKKYTKNIVKNTINTEVGKLKKNLNQKNQLKIQPDRMLFHHLNMMKKLSHFLKN